MVRKKILSFIAAFVAASQALTFVTATGVAEKTIPDANIGYISADVSESLPDNDELLRMYLEKMFYGDGISLYADYGASHLTGQAKALYLALKEQIKEVAAGTRKSSEFTYIPETPYEDSNDFGADFFSVIDCLMVDMPSELYWFDKTTGYSYNITTKTVGNESTLVYTMILAVSSDYANKNGATTKFNYIDGTSKTVYLEVNTTKINTAKKAVENAQRIASECADLSYYEKVDKFREEICALTEYNHSAADANTNTPYGDPWQMVWVFDGDPKTNVVCEGYSKAFQYLCDLTGVECYIVTGSMGGPHMWNIVVMDDSKSYIVDITNCDEGTIGYPDKLFLKGATTSSAKRCTFAHLNNLSYIYDTDLMYDTDLLTVSTTDYEPPAACEHVWGNEWASSVDGHWHICSECGGKSAIEKHTEAFDKDSAVAETCTTDGKAADTICSICGFIVKEGEVIAAHHTIETVQENIVGATCTEAGSYESVERCIVCKEEISRKKVTDEKLPHTPGEPEHKDEVAATCAEEGFYTEVISCTICGTEISSEKKTIEKLPHTIDNDVWDSDDDTHWHVCSVCKETTEPAEHTFNVKMTPATCTEDGEKVSTCVDCGKEMVEVLTKTGHKWDNGKVTKEPTCVDKGVKTFTCSKCNETKTEDIDTVDHTWNDGEITTPATCAAEGVKTITCTVCKTTKTETVAKLPHTFDDSKWEIDGDNHTNTCTVCSEVITEKHDFTDGTTTTEPTCTEEGEMTYTCVCGETSTESIDALGHDPGEAVRENEVAATVDKEGSYDSVIRCKRCDEVIESNKVTIPKLTPADEIPFIKGEDGKTGWDAIGDEIEFAKDKDVIDVDMNKTTTVPKDILEELRGKDVTISFELDNDLVWSVNGKNVDNGDLKDIDLAVTTGSDFIPKNVIDALSGEKAFAQLRLAHDGEFGFTAELSINVGKDNANLFASLYYYNDGKLDKIDTKTIGSDGIVKFSFKHASDYLVTIHEEKASNEPANDQNTSKPDDTNPSGNPNTGIQQDSLIWIAALSCLVLTAPVFKRSKKSGK